MKLILRSKLWTLLLTLSLLLGSVCGVTAAPASTDGIFALLSELKIMTGDPDGNLRLDDLVTRAEFTKTAVASSSYKDSVASHLSISPFQDVSYRHWAAPYVRVGVTCGLVSGYPDATFRPDEPVLYEEAITILLRVLGYNDSDFAAAWPYGQLGMANNLGLTEQLDCSAGEVMNRRQVAKLLYNTLGTKSKGQATQLAALFDTSIYEDVTLISDNLDDVSIASDEVYTSQGIFKINDGFDRAQLGRKGDAAVKNGNKLLAFVPTDSAVQSEEYILYSVLPETLMVYQNGALTQISISDNTTAYRGKTQSTFAALKSSLELGDILRLSRSGSGIDSITCRKGMVNGPATVSASGLNANWETDSDTKVIRNGQSSALTALQPYDIAYFMPDMNLILAYSDKVTGIYENASPNKDMPQSITISGKEYAIESGSAFSALASGGTFAYGDSITALLGKNGQIADVISSNANVSDRTVGYILESGRKEYQTGVVDSYTGYSIKVAFPDGTTGEYATDKDFSTYKNQVATISFQNGYAQASILHSAGAGNLGGTYTHANRRLGNNTLAPDVKILDVGTLDSNATSVYCRVYPQRLDGIRLSSSQILYAEKNTIGEISKLILRDVTDDGFSYGLMISSSQNTQSFSGSYRYLIDGQIYQFNTGNRLLNVSSGAGIKLSGNPTNPDAVSRLIELRDNIKILSATLLTAGSDSYPISPGVSVYQKSASYSSDYVKIPVSDLIGKTDLSLSAYYDKAPSAGGQVRVIVVY